MNLVAERRQVIKSCSPEQVKVLFPRPWNVQHCWSPRSRPKQPCLSSCPLATLLTDDTFFPPSTRTQAFQGSACHWQSLLCRTVPMPQLRAHCCCLGSFSRAPAKPGRCYLPLGKRKPHPAVISIYSDNRTFLTPPQLRYNLCSWTD